MQKTRLYRLQTFGSTGKQKHFMEEHSAKGTSSIFSAQRHMEEVVQTPFSPERSSCGGRGELRRDLGWRMFGESRRAGERRGEQRRRKPGGKMFKKGTQTNVDSGGPRRQVHSYRGKEREVGGGPGWG